MDCLPDYLLRCERVLLKQLGYRRLQLRGLHRVGFPIRSTSLVCIWRSLTAIAASPLLDPSQDQSLSPDSKGELRLVVDRHVAYCLASALGTSLWHVTGVPCRMNNNICSTSNWFLLWDVAWFDLHIKPSVLFDVSMSSMLKRHQLSLSSCPTRLLVIDMSRRSQPSTRDDTPSLAPVPRWEQSQTHHTNIRYDEKCMALGSL